MRLEPAITPEKRRTLRVRWILSRLARQTTKDLDAAILEDSLYGCLTARVPIRKELDDLAKEGIRLADEICQREAQVLHYELNQNPQLDSSSSSSSESSSESDNEPPPPPPNPQPTLINDMAAMELGEPSGELVL